MRRTRELERSMVLLVEDDRGNRVGCAEYLSRAGFAVAEARDGFEALEQTFALGPDLILLDMALPGLDGWQVVRRLKANTRTRQIPVVVLSALVHSGDAERALELGCDAFLDKPCRPEVLVSELERVLDERRRRRRAARRRSARRSPDESLTPAK